MKSSILTVIRTIVLFVPLGYLFLLLGLNFFWLTYPFTDPITSIVVFIFVKQFFKQYKVKKNE